MFAIGFDAGMGGGIGRPCAVVYLLHTDGIDFFLFRVGHVSVCLDTVCIIERFIIHLEQRGFRYVTGRVCSTIAVVEHVISGNGTTLECMGVLLEGCAEWCYSSSPTR